MRDRKAMGDIMSAGKRNSSLSDFKEVLYRRFAFARRSSGGMMRSGSGCLLNNELTGVPSIKGKRKMLK
jgi:hypothetical protein